MLQSLMKKFASIVITNWRDISPAVPAPWGYHGKNVGFDQQNHDVKKCSRYKA